MVRSFFSSPKITYLGVLFLELINMVVKIAVNSFASFKANLILSDEISFDSKINSNQKTVSSASS